jgi:hypothetical protein
LFSARLGGRVANSLELATRPPCSLAIKSKTPTRVRLHPWPHICIIINYLYLGQILQNPLFPLLKENRSEGSARASSKDAPRSRFRKSAHETPSIGIWAFVRACVAFIAHETSLLASGPLSKLALPLAFSCAHPRNNRGGVREGTRGGGIGVDAPLPCRLPSLQYLKLALLTLLDLPELTPLPSLQYLKLAPCSLRGGPTASSSALRI